MFAIKAAARAVRSLPQNVRSVSCQEIQIPVPWGHIAGKWWGPQDKRPILSLHGWQDNCGTFDLLIPSLPEHLSYLAIDLPGHGHSSWLPPGAFYHEIDYVTTIRLLQQFMGWKKVSFMGHSLGAIISYVFGLVYPEEVDFMICLDGLQPRVNLKGVSSARSVIDNFLSYSKQHSPCYTLQEIEKLNAHGRKLSLDKIQCVLKRSIKEVEGKYCLTRDPRIKSTQLVTWSEESVKENSKSLTFPLLHFIYNAHLYEENLRIYREVVQILKEFNKKFHLVELEGVHCEHLNNHDKFTRIITNFIMKFDKFDRSCDPIANKINYN